MVSFAHSFLFLHTSIYTNTCIHEYYTAFNYHNSMVEHQAIISFAKWAQCALNITKCFVSFFEIALNYLTKNEWFQQKNTQKMFAFFLSPNVHQKKKKLRNSASKCAGGKSSIRCFSSHFKKIKIITKITLFIMYKAPTKKVFIGTSTNPPFVPPST